MIQVIHQYNKLLTVDLGETWELFCKTDKTFCFEQQHAIAPPSQLCIAPSVNGQ